MAGFLAHGIWLTLVLCHASVYLSKSTSAWIFFGYKVISTYWTMSGRIGDLKTLGNVTLSLLALPSGEMTVTVGRLVILSWMCYNC